jgi:hypothetical protein
MIATAALFSFPAAAGAVDGVGAASAISSGGFVATGGAFIPSSQGQGGISATFVAPSGTCTGGSSVSGVDFCKPWVSVVEGYASGGFVGSQNCATVANPTGWSSGSLVTPASNWPTSGAPTQPLSGIYVDAACNDGSGYDFYRVQINDWSDANGPWGLFNDMMWGTPVGLGAANPIYWGAGAGTVAYKGTVSFASDNGAIEVASSSVYGHNAGGFQLLSNDGSGRVYPMASDVVTTAG